jgi:small-conductance mechanosensitive channel
MSVLTTRPACADDPSTWCSRLFEVTNNGTISRAADVVAGGVLQIVLIAALAVLARVLLFRLIHRLTEGAIATRVSKLMSRSPALNRDGGAIATERSMQRARTVSSVLRSIASAVVLLVAVAMMLAQFDVNLGPILASAGIVGLAVGFGAQNLVRDFLSGMFMLLEDQYGVGDIVDFDVASGEVESVSLRITTLRDANGTVWYVRNGEIQRVGNKSQGFAVAVVDVPLAHNVDIGSATETLARAATARAEEADIADHVLEAPQVLGVESVSTDGVTLRLTARVSPGQQFAVQRALNAAVTSAFGSGEKWRGGSAEPTAAPAPDPTS